MLIRSIIFYSLLNLWTLIMGIICIPFLLLPNKLLKKPVNVWIFGIFELLKLTCNITYEIKGKENILNKPVLVASKHQSTFDTFVLYLFLKKSVFIHKKELFYIPIFGQYLKKSSMISIDRKEGASAMRKMLKEANNKISQGYSIIIFPEGTRKKPGEKPNYKRGFVGIYNEIQTEILPVALNTGLCWPKNSFIKQPGHITIKFLNIIPAGLKKEKVMKILEERIENESNKII